ncbi:hypothetical protein JVT61DRAFT_6489 [Boletus reticuloceps]|uniref:Uncharacterized protein n=1 Tax=Boletus reticuloceps TaxID=495285 RepID=A0A8I2YJN8_9AGAM|nr:hypothetical protein JVT61DRAFT_6489 [Boletus reticuloceps]
MHWRERVPQVASGGITHKFRSPPDLTECPIALHVCTSSKKVEPKYWYKCEFTGTQLYLASQQVAFQTRCICLGQPQCQQPASRPVQAPRNLLRWSFSKLTMIQQTRAVRQEPAGHAQPDTEDTSPLDSPNRSDYRLSAISCSSTVNLVQPHSDSRPHYRGEFKESPFRWNYPSLSDLPMDQQEAVSKSVTSNGEKPAMRMWEGWKLIICCSCKDCPSSGCHSGSL